MGSRIDWLTDFAQPIAKEMKPRCGTFKQMLSAGIMALNELTPEERDYYMDKASGKDMHTKKLKFRSLPIQPEEKAILMPDADVERMLKILIKFKPVLIFQVIGQALSEVPANLQNADDLATAQDDKIADISGPAKKKHNPRKRESSKSG